MSSLLDQYNKAVKNYCKDLYVVYTPNGMYQVWRDDWEKVSLQYLKDQSGIKDGLQYAHMTVLEKTDLDTYVQVKSPYLVLPITDDWSLTGKPIEVGELFLINKLQEIDGQRDDSIIGDNQVEYEKNEKIKQISRVNEFKAIAADTRCEFAKLTNEFLVRSLPKIDRRRLKGA